MSDHASPALDPNRRRIIVGLGNPGRDYARTRHNIGFQIADALADKHGLKFAKMMNRSIIALGEIDGAKVILAKPQTYMNDSGASVGPIVKFYKVELADLLVIYDELDIPFAQLRMRPFGGTGGHNGMRSITDRLGSQDFPRLRVGIGRPPGRMDPRDYVLAPFTADERAQMAEAVDRAMRGIALWLTQGIDRAMNVVNLPAQAAE
jgi:PTH1 family peptidyl-tRNA hydrolase